MRALTNLIVLILTLAVATVLAGWWAIPLVAGVWTLIAPRRAAVFYAAVAASTAWSTLLLLRSSGGGVTRVDSLLSQIMHVHGSLLIGLTIFYPALLAGAAALVAQSIRPGKTRGERGTGNVE